MKKVLLSIVCLGVLACSQKNPTEHSPEASLADLKVYNGLQVELFASEPMFSNPTNMDVDSRGRVWVTEAYNYRHQWNPQNPVRSEGDRIMILEDTDGDGKADKSTVFYQGTDVNAALGICVLGNKVIVSCSPNIFVFTDNDGDDKPDKKEVMFQRIGGLDLDHAVHSFNFAHDGRLYFNMGNEGKIMFDTNGDTVVDVYGHKVITDGKPFRDGLALRTSEDGKIVEVLGHNFRNNYELAVDPYGTVWQSDNDDDGNKGVRINYIMEFGNYGYKDELTGAAWQARRTNMEKEIPLRHWHLNDPGVIPNVLQTGSGSPTGIAMYEGTMLPKEFYGQMIHAEPGHNVVRSYPIEKDGAGYKATIVNILEGQKDQWFRPADVTIAPDGSLFIADWYDPGVGGHQVGDLDRGRIYRVSTNKSEYKVKAVDVSTPENAVQALISPNPATRYLGYKALVTMDTLATNALEKLWSGKNPRHQAMAFWILARIDGSQYIPAALASENPDIRIAGIRAARLQHADLEHIWKTTGIVNDPSPQVRRELLLAMRASHVSDPDTWTKLAKQYDGKDRWYLEALGIAADEHWDEYFSNWKKSVGVEWDTPAGRDIVWRSRSKSAMPLLAELIRSADDSTMLRYYRAFDFHKDASRQQILTSLVSQVKGVKQLYALKHMDPAKIKMTPAINTALQKTLSEYKDKIEFVELITTFNLRNRTNDLVTLALKYPDSLQGRESTRTLFSWNETESMKKILKGNNKENAVAMVQVIRSNMGDKRAIAMMEDIMMDPTRDIELRKAAVRTFGGPWTSEDRLLELAKEKKIPADLQTAVAGVFQTVWRAALREEAAKYLSLPGNREGKPLPPVSTLVTREGDAGKGQVVFANTCAQCHMVNGKGTNFGPDLSEIGEKLSPEAIYTAILYPDQGISFGYEGYSLKLNDGSTVIGRIVSETEEKIDLQYMANTQSVKPSDVASKSKLPNSLMPAELQKLMTEEEIVGLVEYLKGLKRPEVAGK
jgi:putative membrane-bound dehydrogenase-like protein